MKGKIRNLTDNFEFEKTTVSYNLVSLVTSRSEQD